MRALAAVALVIGLAAPAAAQPTVPWTAADLKEACADGELYFLYGACMGVIAAAVPDMGVAICLPEGATLFELDAAADALAGIDIGEDSPAAELAKLALSTAFAC